MKNLSLVLFFGLSILLFSSCQKDALDDLNNGQAAPELPTASMFIMPMESFTELDNVTGNVVGTRSITNWGHAASNVLVWSTLVRINMTIPIVAFYESFNHDAEYQGAGVWMWSYEVMDNGKRLRAELYGELLDTDEVEWNMYVSEVNGPGKIHWYTGTTANDRSYANWELYYNVNDPSQQLNIDFTRDLSTGDEAIKYTNIAPNNPADGGYIQFEKSTDSSADFDRFFDVFNAEEDNLLEIKWNETNHNGQVKDPKYFNDTEWHCWGNDLRDTNC